MVRLAKLYKKKPKIAIWTEGGWSLGKVYKGLKSSLDSKYDVDFHDWSNNDNNKKLWTDGGWKDYDVIMGNTALTFYPEELNYLKELPEAALNKMIIGIWANLSLDNAHFTERIKYTKGPIFHCVTRDIQKSAKDVYNVDATLIKAGKPTSDFKPFKTVNKIKTLGLNGSPNIGEEWCKIKRPKMFAEIAEKSNCKHLFIFNSPEKDNKIYKDIDMYVCTSTSESGPAGIMECALSKIPVISTKTGHAKNIKSVKTFETVDEAVNIIKELNSSPELLNDYIEEVYNEVINEYDWANVAPKYWIPLIEKLLNKS